MAALFSRSALVLFGAKDTGIVSLNVKAGPDLCAIRVRDPGYFSIHHRHGAGMATTVRLYVEFRFRASST
ncbi:MAG: hypothetical protein MK102_00250 [Fuerstiella sp.]|nr:hypothetical protein [Fuerstiella sp.]